MAGKEAIAIYELSRNILPQFDQLSKLINQISNPKLRSVLVEIHNTVQADFLVFNDVIIEALNCETPEQLDELLNLFEDSSES